MNGPSWDGSYVALPQVAVAWAIAGSGDFNADGQPDIVWQNTSTGDRSIWFMAGNVWGAAYAALPQVSTQWSIAGVGDFNADGKPDLVWQNTTTGDRSIWYMNGSTWSGNYSLLPNVPTQWDIAAVADFNSDTKPDLVWQNTSTGERSIWYMNGGTVTAYALLPTVPPAWRITAAADFEGDTDPDLVWQNVSTGERSIWLMTGSTWGGSYASLPTVSTQWDIAGVFPAALTYIVTGGWNCASSTSCQDVYDISLPANTKVTAAVTNIAGNSALRLAAFDPGVALSGRNLMTGQAVDRMCNAYNISDAPILRAKTAGVYRLAIGRDWGQSLGLNGTYTLTVTTDQPMVPRSQTVSDAATGLPTTHCGYTFSTGSGWTCATSVSCQDVFDFETLEATPVTVSVTAVTGNSIVRLAAFDGAGVNTTNRFNGTLADRMCATLFNASDAATTPTLPLGQHRFAVGRDWNNSAGTDGNYTVTITTPKAVLVEGGQTLNNTASAFATRTCP